MKINKVISVLLIISLGLSVVVPTSLTRAQAANPSLLTIDGPNGPNDIIEVIIDKEVRNSDGSVTVDIKIKASRRIAYDLTFDAVGNADSSLQALEVINFLPLYPKNTYTIGRLTFRQGSSLIIKQDKWGYSGSDRAIMFVVDLASFVMFLVGATPPTQLDFNSAIDMGSEILRLLPTTPEGTILILDAVDDLISDIDSGAPIWTIASDFIDVLTQFPGTALAISQALILVGISLTASQVAAILGTAQVLLNSPEVFEGLWELITRPRHVETTINIRGSIPSESIVDVILIIDSSGSMAWNDPNNQRLGAARVYLSASQPGDRVAVVDFDSDVRLASGLLPALVGGQRNQDLVNAINSIDSSGATNIRGGIEMACQELIDHGQASKRGAILLTDGEHNVGPFGNPQQCFADRGWPIFTFGFGDANVTLLQQVASQTGGEFKHINNVSSLACEFQRVRALIAGVQPQPCSVIRVDPFVNIQFLASVPPGQSQATFSTSWYGSDIVMSLTSPSGRAIGRSTVAPDVIHDLGSSFEVYTILNPEPGDWSVNLYGADVPPGGEDVIFGFTTIPLPNQPPALLIPGDQSSQYSDQLSFTITASDPNDPPDSLTFLSTDLPNDLVLTDNGDGTATVSGIVNVAPGTYAAEITVTDPDGLSDTEIIPILVNQEDARATYTGPMLVSTSCADCSTAIVPLRATIQDITAVTGDLAYDADPGNITNATVTFVNRDNANAPLCSASVILLDPADPKVGTATCDWTADIGNSTGSDYTIGVVVNGYYTRDSTEDDTVVVVSKPTSYFITGGGYLINQNSAGLYAGDPGEKTNFGLNVKFDKKLKNLKGRVTIIVRIGGSVYQIKSNALSSLAVVPYDPANPNSGTAELISKANITDVTDPLYPIEILGNATLQIRMKDNGEPGTSDLISITLWGSDGSLLFSSNWDGTQTIQQFLDGGNLAVH